MAPPPSLSSAPSATYSSPTATHDFTVAAQAKSDIEPSSKAQSQSAHLAALRASTKQLQNDINTFLTTKMEQDKASAAAVAATDSKGKKAGKSRDEQEEENYGEEKVEDD